MPDNAIYQCELLYQRLTDPTASFFDVRTAIEYFVKYPREREFVGEQCVAYALRYRALRDDLLLPDKAVWGLVQMEAWDELGRLVCALIAPDEELGWSYYQFHDHRRETSLTLRLKLALIEHLSEPVDTAPLWPVLRRYFRRKDKTIRERAITLAGELHVVPAYRTLRRIVEDPAQAQLHRQAVKAIGLLNSSAAQRYIIQLLRDPERQDLGLLGVSYSCDPKAIPILSNLLADSDSAMMHKDILLILGEIGGDKAARVLLKHLDGPYRQLVISALGSTGSDIAVPQLKRLLRGRTTSQVNRDRAAEALSEIDTPKARRVLAATLAKSRKGAASSAGSALSARRQY